VLSGPAVILTLKIAVAAVTLLVASSLVPLLRGNYRLHGRINTAFFILTLATLLGFEVLIRVIQPELFDYIRANPAVKQALDVHLCFAVPAALLMPLMLYTGLTRRRSLHLGLAGLFAALWIGTFVTGVFFLPHTAP
jgi:uncharacterized membrane protein YozB (DUF420 family)